MPFAPGAGGQVFDETPLRDLLIEAIRYADLPATRAKMEQVIDDSVAQGLGALIEDRAFTPSPAPTSSI